MALYHPTGGLNHLFRRIIFSIHGHGKWFMKNCISFLWSEKIIVIRYNLASFLHSFRENISVLTKCNVLFNIDTEIVSRYGKWFNPLVQWMLYIPLFPNYNRGCVVEGPLIKDLAIGFNVSCQVSTNHRHFWFFITFVGELGFYSLAICLDSSRKKWNFPQLRYRITINNC